VQDHGGPGSAAGVVGGPVQQVGVEQQQVA
ncbi:uncharacterized protein METZ01_LOCUS256013, partial [marine metagenome]